MKVSPIDYKLERNSSYFPILVIMMNNKWRNLVSELKWLNTKSGFKIKMTAAKPYWPRFSSANTVMSRFEISLKTLLSVNN